MDSPYPAPNNCDWYNDKQAICAKNEQGLWRWVGKTDIGLITVAEFCPDEQFVSSGQTIYTCGANTYFGMQDIQKIQNKVTIQGHDYLCSDLTIIECGGDTPYSPNAKQTGNTLVLENSRVYCTEQGSWSESLDAAGEASCTAAGFDWTGNRCCGEPDDPRTTYDDTDGTCFNNRVVRAGVYLDGEKDIINYHGTFYVCEPNRQPNAQSTTTHALLQGVTPMGRGPCGMPLADAKTMGSRKHALCDFNGEWVFVSTVENYYVKQTSWQITPTKNNQGCCTENKCWDGTTCVGRTSYVNIGGSGYQCQ